MGAGKTLAADLGAWLCFEDETGCNTRPHKARTWARRGHTPVLPYWAGSQGRISVAGLLCVKPGERTRLLHRVLVHHRRRSPPAPRSFLERHYLALLDDAHRRLGGPIVLIWDNLDRHISARIRPALAARDWLHVIRLPAYAPELNPVEGVWSHLKRGLANLAPVGLNDLVPIVRRRLRLIRNRPDLLDGFLAHTGLTLTPEPT
ncbi:transposase [Saccharothrix algeriensis]|uniref:Transposase n=2 Tax=Saccharothrix algeriensis TaxID=173560 RepID=A0ABS2S289_9PSEU|nr:transposase [Saccharothrix algeriensis]MBM7809371.1 putative transposase [Saccharothrix algeriensis]MBM7809640.1 putative transposase [Saccharothrix algeriensis]MBM7809934.1 putative transposase [Saccharothrix algeriensis]MBM7810357.1 putative transposase [Saccharothrix algeriensis]MBM7811743.1 putative transposase [Saccharothrix algeriensis]